MHSRGKAPIFAEKVFYIDGDPLMKLTNPFRPNRELDISEIDYRQSFLGMDIDMAGLGVGIGIVSTIALSYIDYLFLKY
jgi:hypothetical protein